MATKRKSATSPARKLAARIAAGRARIGIIGLGYVGLPLACLFAEKGFPVTGFDIDTAKTGKLAQGRSYIRHIPGKRIAPLVKAGTLSASSDFAQLKRMDAIIICVPTPLSRQRDPDLSYVANTAREIGRHLQKGQLIVLESSTYPGTTDEVVKPELEARGLKSGRDFFLAYSPEREDPGNEQYGTAAIPKVVGGDGADALELALALYNAAVVKTVPASSPATAEAVKLTENIFRSVNIALVNELKVIFDAMGIDVWEVIDAAKTKPFGFMPFYPGPGLGGHCIPIDPFYLTWKAREFGIATRFIELAGEINTAMPRYVIGRLTEALSDRAGKAVKGARILIVGLAYKKNVDDMRESPALTLIDLLEELGAKVDYHDPIITSVKPSREHPHLAGRRSVALSPANLKRADAVLIVTDHDSIDYRAIGQGARLILDTRNRMARAGWRGRNVIKA
ncbi:nucleotide sugar dehydrogenase [Dongia sp.]|uniref:nucleotide sugar dehydrogenase n=1 Tax=Dongia sp. TaxID=1977262 RepID=UPI0035B2DF74